MVKTVVQDGYKDTSQLRDVPFHAEIGKTIVFVFMIEIDIKKMVK